ncbi:MAG TPA: DUF5074 domain-containing protein, partial [Cyclobacteriaceae bacterium]|nr:DUF5074 domain-containing protein [Cyclobacteriaceae bacterium]
ENGVFVVNEGNFADADGEITYIDFISGDVRHKLFQGVNSRPFAGVLQSMTMHEGYAYLIDQLGRLEVVEAASFNSAGDISEGLVIPRYISAYGNRGFITDWGPYDENYLNNESRVIEVDLENLSIIKTITTDSRPEGIYADSSHIFVANSATDKISIYDTQDLTPAAQITVPPGPVRFVEDMEGNLWIACTGNYTDRSALVRISRQSLTVTATILVPEGIVLNGGIAINGAGDMIYYLSEQWAEDFSYTLNNIFTHSVHNINFNYSALLSRKNIYGLGVDPVGKGIFLADAVAFQANGWVYVYNENGALLDSVNVDRGPRDFVFVNEE